MKWYFVWNIWQLVSYIFFLQALLRSVWWSSNQYQMGGSQLYHRNLKELVICSDHSFNIWMIHIMNSRMKLEKFLNFLNLFYFIRFWNTHLSPSLFLKYFCAGLPVKEFISIFWRTWVVVLGPFLLSPIVLCSPEDPQTLEALKCAYLILLMAVYWMTEALPLPITSMIPMVGNISID